MTFRLFAVFALPLAFTWAILASLAAAPAMALPQSDTCLITIYYNNAAHDEVVGSRAQCTGSPIQTTGHTSPFKETMRVAADTPHHPPAGNTSLPCEFLVSGCGIFAPGHGAPKF